MSYIYRQLLIVISFFLSLSFIGCDGQGDKASLTISFPEVSGVVTSSSSIVHSSNSSENWNTSLNPGNINDVNCYGVAVSGPEPFMQRNNVKNKTTGEVYNFGRFEAAFTEGSTVVLDGVPSGQDRKIMIVGWKTQGGACRDLFAQDPAFNDMSSPFLIGSTQMDLVPGDNDVPVFVSMTGAIELANFSGPRFDGIGNWTPGPGPITNLFGDGRDGDQVFSNGDLETLSYDLSAVPGSASTSIAKKFNKYAQVVGINGVGTTLTLGTGITPDFIEPGDEIMWHITSGWAASDPDANACGGIPRGSWGFSKVTAVSSPGITIETALNGDNGGADYGTLNSRLSSLIAHGTEHCMMHVVRVPNFNILTLNSGNYYSSPFTNSNGRGMIVFKAKELVLNGAVTFFLEGKGLPGGAAARAGYGLGGPSPAGTDTPNENGGAHGSSMNGSGGGSTAGPGGMGSSSVPGGAGVNYCNNPAPSVPCLPIKDRKIMLGSGGGGSDMLSGGDGGGAALLHIEKISGAFVLTINASGENGQASTNESGAGSGGTVHLTVKEMDVVLSVDVSGGDGGTMGGGGAGGVIEIPYCASLSSGSFATLDASGGNGYGGVATTGVVENIDEPTLCN